MAEYIGPNFTKPKDTYMTVTIGTNDEPLTLRILPPTVSTFRGVQRALDFLDPASSKTDVTLEDAREYVANMLSNNIECHRVTAKYLEDTHFGLEDMGVIIGAYVSFVSRVIDGKN